jgi:hypothetical protein
MRKLSRSTVVLVVLLVTATPADAAPFRFQPVRALNSVATRIGGMLSRPIRQATIAIKDQARRVGLDKYIPILRFKPLGMGVVADQDLLLFRQRVSFSKSILLDRLDAAVTNDIVARSQQAMHRKVQYATDADSVEARGLLDRAVRERRNLARQLRTSLESHVDAAGPTFWKKPPGVKWRRLENGDWHAQFGYLGPRPANESRLLKLLPHLFDRARADHLRLDGAQENWDAYAQKDLNSMRFEKHLKEGRISAASKSTYYADYEWVPGEGARPGHYRYTPFVDQSTSQSLQTAKKRLAYVEPSLLPILDLASERRAIARMVDDAAAEAMAGGKNSNHLVAVVHRAEKEWGWARQLTDDVSQRAMTHAVSIDSKIIESNLRERMQDPRIAAQLRARAEQLIAEEIASGTH